MRAAQGNPLFHDTRHDDDVRIGPGAGGRWRRLVPSAARAALPAAVRGHRSSPITGSSTAWSSGGTGSLPVPTCIYSLPQCVRTGVLVHLHPARRTLSDRVVIDGPRQSRVFGLCARNDRHAIQWQSDRFTSNTSPRSRPSPIGRTGTAAQLRSAPGSWERVRLTGLPSKGISDHKAEAVRQKILLAAQGLNEVPGRAAGPSAILAPVTPHGLGRDSRQFAPCR